ncbi:MAG: dihydroxy-acid dehydratase [Actinobacteria bacterium]|nr:dihydroxy-acid dehydratase [Actinomycetota bacterium]
MTSTYTLRSSQWFNGNDEVALSHRVVMASVGYKVEPDNDRPIIGIADSSSELNPCNLPLRDYIADIKAGVIEAGGIPVVFPVMSLGEDLMKPSAMLYRNLLSMEIEEYVRSYPLDGIVLLANCDKSVPGALMGAASANIPTIMFTAGARPAAVYRGKKIGTGTDLWRMWADFRSGKISQEEWNEFEGCLNCGLGSCNTMGTASSVALMVEALGMSLPGTSTIPSGDPARKVAAVDSGKEIVAMVKANTVPSEIMTPKAFRNAIRVLHACGGSTNALIHLIAISGRIGGELTLEKIATLGENIPVLADVEPSGTGLIQDFHAAGGLPALINEMDDLLELDSKVLTGKSLGDSRTSKSATSKAIRGLDNPLRTTGAFEVVFGNLAPTGAVIKVSAASDELIIHSGPAVVFTGYNDMRNRIDDPELEVTKESVLVLSGCGAVGVPGMPEWGMIPIPKKLAAQGVVDMVRVTDSRMSGTSFGTCVLHVSPEGAVGGVIGLVKDGDIIELDVSRRSLSLKISDEELAVRKASWAGLQTEHLRGWPSLYQAHVLQPDEGSDFDFLRAPTPEMRRFVPPVIGRS